jgi:hypothetical protein
MEHELTRQMIFVVVIAGLIGLSILFWLLRYYGKSEEQTDPGCGIVAVIYVLLVIVILAIVVFRR